MKTIKADEKWMLYLDKTGSRFINVGHLCFYFKSLYHKSAISSEECAFCTEKVPESVKLIINLHKGTK